MNDDREALSQSLYRGINSVTHKHVRIYVNFCFCLCICLIGLIFGVSQLVKMTLECLNLWN